MIDLYAIFNTDLIVTFKDYCVYKNLEFDFAVHSMKWFITLEDANQYKSRAVI